MTPERAARRADSATDTSSDQTASLSRRELLRAGAGLTGAFLAAGALQPRSSLAGLVARAAAVPPRGRDLGAVEHVVIVLQENRSFDHYFGVYRGVQGFADRRHGTGLFAQQLFGSPKRQLPFHLDAATAQAQCAGSADIPVHDWGPQHDSWNSGHMDSFVQAHAPIDGAAQAPLVMSYFTRDDLPYYYALADAFTICDSYFCSVIGPTMPNRLYSLSATIDPSGSSGGPVLSTPSFVGPEAAQAVGSVNWPTMPEALQDHGISWKVYQPPGSSVGPAESNALGVGFNALLYFRQLLANPSTPLYQRAFLPTFPDEYAADVQRGTLPQVSWVLPPLVDSEHPSASPGDGEAHVSNILAPLLANPDVWAKTVVFLTYDENGGFFDHVPPPTAPPGTEGEYLTVQPLPSRAAGQPGPIGLGFRVPMLVVSPFSRGGYVNSDTFDHTSLLRFLETRFGVPVPNLTAWRRRTVGDLTSAIDVTAANASVPRLPSAVVDTPSLHQACPENQSLALFLAPAPRLNLPIERRLPRPEPGAPRRRRR